MATKKSAAKKSSKKAAAKKAGAKKAAAKKGGAKKAGAAKPKPSQGKCGNWKAWIDVMPPGPPTLYVTGECRFPTHGYKVTLKPAVPQGINPRILLLRKIVTPPSGPVILIPQTVPVNYKQRTKTNYTHVTILPDNVTIKVQIVS